MDLLEYQAKELFREMGIPVLPSQQIEHPRDIKALQLPYPIVLKSQVRAGGRGRAGGVRFAENTIDAIATAWTIFNLPILGEYPKVLLAEAKYDVTQEFYLAVVLDYTLQRPVLLGSTQGGINIEALMQQMQQVVVEQDFSPFYARHLTTKMGLQGSLIQLVSDIVEKIYRLFVQKDLDLVEINPLGVSSTNEIMALDGKITVNDNALGRHRDLALLGSIADDNTDPLIRPATRVTNETGGRIREGNANAMIIEQSAREEFGLTKETEQPLALKSVDKEGNIGIVCNGTSLALATLDLVYEAGGKPAKCLVIGGDVPWKCHPIGALLEIALEQVTQIKSQKVVLVNILDSTISTEEIASVISPYLQRKIPLHSGASPRRVPEFVIRLGGDEINLSSEQLAAMPVHWFNKLDEAIEQTVSLAKSPK